ncbi:MAG: co-chaperone DjlA [Gammaproteobacteria bacterium]|nr:co-chaperone DjlA [Gammaproteobacteria bacterium]
MSWWGKILGGTFGFIMGGPLGAVLGAALGHNFDKGLGRFAEGASPGGQARTQLAFFAATFSVMGRLAKADGRVSEDEIAFAKAVMAQMQFNAQQRKLAIDLFTQGRQADFDLDGVLRQFRAECHRRHTLMQMFLEIQLQAAYADGALHPAERELLLHVFAELGFSHHEFDHLDALVRNARANGGYAPRGATPAPTLAEDYAVLDVAKAASDAEVKRAYRRLMSQHHPDKLVAKGLPEEMVKLANEKTSQIRKAYERIKAARAMR